MLRSWIIIRAKVRPRVKVTCVDLDYAQFDASSAASVWEGI
jgi:hypothetical protein